MQSFSPDHPALLLAAEQDYPPFFEEESRTREAMGYPPFSRLAGLLVHSEDRAAAEEHAAKLGRALREAAEGAVAVLGPAPSPLAKIRDRWRFHLLLKSRDHQRSKAVVRRALADAPAPDEVGVDIDVDPLSLL